MVALFELAHPTAHVVEVARVHARATDGCCSSGCCKRRPRPAARMIARIENLGMVVRREFYTAAALPRE
jgi:hypothetical protein